MDIISQEEQSVEGGDDDATIETEYDEEDLEIFEPSAQWQRIKTGIVVWKSTRIVKQSSMNIEYLLYMKMNGLGPNFLPVNTNIEYNGHWKLLYKQ